MGQVVSLGLADYERDPVLTKKQREEGLRNAARAERLLDYPEMKWFLDEQLQQEEHKQWERLLRADNERLADQARGAIKVLRDTTRRLQFMASQRAKLEERLND